MENIQKKNFREIDLPFDFTSFFGAPGLFKIIFSIFRAPWEKVKIGEKDPILINMTKLILKIAKNPGKIKEKWTHLKKY